MEVAVEAEVRAGRALRLHLSGQFRRREWRGGQNIRFMEGVGDGIGWQA
jgi:hypothetical protein